MPQNLFKIFDGRNYFWQWDTNQKLVVLDPTVDEVHFSNRDMSHAIPKDVCTDKDGKRVCYIPDVLLTLPKNLVASAYVTDDNATKTLRSVKFAVRQRPIPADYVTNEDLQFEDFTERLGIIEDIIEDSCLVQRFSTIEDAEQWAKESKDAGAIISVNTGTQWETYVVEDDYNITPISCDEETIIRDIEALRQLVGNSSVVNQIEQYILNLNLPNVYDAKGSAAQALVDAKEYVNKASSSMQAKLDKEVERAQYEEAAITTTMLQINDRATEIQEDVDSLETFVGKLPNSTTAKTIVEYVDAKTEDIASGELVRELSARIEDAVANTLTLKVALADEGENVVADKSFAEIFNAYNDGRTVCVVYRNGIYPLTLIRNDGVVFGLDDGVTHERIMCRSYGDIDTWTYTIEEAIASSYYLGGVRAEPRTDDYTVPVKIGNNGFLYIPEAQEQAKSDWNVNDETSPAYVKNRTHYRAMQDLVTIDDSNITLDVDDKLYRKLYEGHTFPNLGETIHITFNGNTYSFVAHHTDDSYLVFDTMGDTDEELISGTGTYGFSLSWQEWYGYYSYLYTNVKTVNEFKVVIEHDTYVQLPEEYIAYKPGKIVTGQKFIIDGEEVAAVESAEIFNDYGKNIAIGSCSHAEGTSTKAIGYYAHAEGQMTTASGQTSHAEGAGTTASGTFSHAEGQDTLASGSRAHAEGTDTVASGVNAHAEGGYAVAGGIDSHAEGHKTIASSDYQHVQGQYNVEDTTGKYAHIIGNGTSDKTRSNAHTIDWNGLGWFKDGVKVGGTGQDDVTAKLLATTEYVDTAVKQITGVSSLPGVRVAEVSLLSANWVGDASPYSQVLELEGITEYSQVDLKPNIQQLAIFHNKDLSFVTENEDGVVTCYVLGDKPKDDYVMQVAITEVSV